MSELTVSGSKSPVILGIAAAVLVIAAPAFAQCRYELTIFGPPDCPPFGTPSSRGLAISAEGFVTGSFNDCVVGPSHAFQWTETAEFEPLVHPPGVSASTGAGANGGFIVGYMDNPADRGFVYDDGVWTELPPDQGVGESCALDVNRHGVVVGQRSLGGDFLPRNGFIWTKSGGFVDLGTMKSAETTARAVNDRGEVCGIRGFPATEGSEGFIWRMGKVELLGPIPDGGFSSAVDLNNRGDVCVSGAVLVDGVQRVRAFRWRDGAFTPLGLHEGFAQTNASSINDVGQVVGSLIRENSDRHGYLWQDGQLRDLNDLLVPSPDATIESCSEINNRGQITGRARRPGIGLAFVATPVGRPPGDVTIDCRVDTRDVLFLLSDWGQTESPADVDGDGVVGMSDLLIILINWSS